MGRSAGRRAALPRPVRLLLVARTVNQLGAFSVAFLAVLVHTEFRVGVATAGLVTAAFGLAGIPSRLLGGRLADRLGRRRTILLGLGGCAVAQLGIAAAGSLPVAAAWAVLLGLVFELYEPPSQAMIADAVGPAERVRAYGLFTAALALGGLGAGLLAALLGRWDLRWLFAADAASCLACAVIIRLGTPADRPAPLGPPPGAPDHAFPDRVPGRRPGPWRDRGLPALLASGTAFAALSLTITTALPLALAGRGLPAADAGLLMAVSALTTVAAQPLLRSAGLSALPDRRALALGYLLFAAGLSGYALTRPLPAAAPATALWSLGQLLLMGRLYARAAALAPPGATGRYLAAFGTCWGIAGVAAPALATELLQHAGPTGLWAAAAGAALLLAAVHLAARSGAGRSMRPGRARRAGAPSARGAGGTIAGGAAVSRRGPGRRR